MIKSNNLTSTDSLVQVLEALKEKKGKEIVTINLEKLSHAICDYFVICHADSSTQVDALTDAVNDKLKKSLNRKPYHIEGKNNSLWVLLDYGEILVHIFQKEQRYFYNLEELWADGVVEHIDDEKNKK